MAWSPAFNDVFSVAMFANGLVGFGGAGIANTIPAPADWPAVGCDVTGPPALEPPGPIFTSSKSSSCNMRPNRVSQQGPNIKIDIHIKHKHTVGPNAIKDIEWVVQLEMLFGNGHRGI